MSGYFDRGASAGGQDEGYFNRQDVTGPDGVGSATGGPGGVAHENLGVTHDNLVVDDENPNIVRAVPPQQDPALDETAGVTSSERVGGTYPYIIEGSDSLQTGTSWGVPAYEDASVVETPRGEMPEGSEPGEAAPNRNTARNPSKAEIQDVGSWSTIDTDDTAGSPSGLS